MTEPSAWAKARAFNAITNHGDCLLDDYPLDGLIEEVAKALDEARAFGEQDGERFGRSLVASIAYTAGGIIDGQPTSSINVLQRVRQLVEIEQRHS